MTPPIRIHAQASVELTEAIRWYESKRPDLGAELLDEVTSAIDQLSLRPESGNPLSVDQKTRRLLISRFPYQLVYRIRPAEIVVVAIAHVKRRPEYWKLRR